MSKLILIRHGQASFGSSNYDQLSELGHQQARWLGEHFDKLGVKPTRLIRGDLLRHKQTADSLMAGLGMSLSQQEDSDWNEFDFHAIGRQYLEQFPEQQPSESTPKAFFGLLRNALLAWSQGDITGQQTETWLEFESRIATALDNSCSDNDSNNDIDETVIVVSSGGAISMAMKQLLQCSNSAVIDMNLQTRNTGVSEVFFKHGKRYLSSFNGLPHMLHPDRLQFITSA